MINKKALKDAALGGIVNNPTFVMVLGMCPLIATSINITNSFAMGLATTFVLIFSNIFISLLRKIIPDQIRLPAYIVIIASFVTIVQLFMDKYLPDLYDQMSGFIKLIVVNCIIFARAEAFSGKSENGTLASLVDGVSMGLGFTAAITLLGATRQFLAEVLNIQMATTSAGGFLVLGLMMALFNAIFYYARRCRANKCALKLQKGVQ